MEDLEMSNELYCCGELMDIRGVYDVETKRSSLLIRCKSCNYIEERPLDGGLINTIKFSRLSQNSCLKTNIIVTKK